MTAYGTCPVCDAVINGFSHACSTVRTAKPLPVGKLKSKSVTQDGIYAFERLQKIHEELKEYFRTRPHLRRGRLWKAYQETL